MQLFIPNKKVLRYLCHMTSTRSPTEKLIIPDYVPLETIKFLTHPVFIQRVLREELEFIDQNWASYMYLTSNNPLCIVAYNIHFFYISHTYFLNSRIIYTWQNVRLFADCCYNY